MYHILYCTCLIINLLLAQRKKIIHMHTYKLGTRRAEPHGVNCFPRMQKELLKANSSKGAQGFIMAEDAMMEVRPAYPVLLLQ